MKVELFDKFVQIGIENDNEVLPKILRYAKKYFQKQYQLSTSILILDDGERFKKDYLINWSYYLAMQHDELSSDESTTLESILSYSYLPIRIKITASKSLLECVKISFQILSNSRAAFVLSRPNHVARRYIVVLLSHLVVYSDVSRIYLDSSKSDFWVCIMNIIGNKVIHNIKLEFDYDSFKTNRFKIFKSSYFTKQEMRLKNALNVLECDINDSFLIIKSKYLNLIKQYHPDKVFSKNEDIIKAYNLKFIEIKEAFDIIKEALSK